MASDAAGNERGDLNAGGSSGRTGRSETNRLYGGAPLPPGPMASFIVSVIALLLIALFSYRSLQSSSVTADQVNRTTEVNEQLLAVLSHLKDAETGQRGYLLTGQDVYLQPYTDAKVRLNGVLGQLRSMLAGNERQLRRFEELNRLSNDKLSELEETVVLRRAGKTDAAMAVVLTDRGKAVMDRVRSTVAEMQTEERATLAKRQAEWADAQSLSLLVSWGGSALLLVLITVSALLTSRDFRARMVQAWVRNGQAQLASRLQGEQRLEVLGDTLLAFLADYMNAQIGAAYVAQPDGRFHRFAGYAISATDTLRPGEGMLGQAAKNNRVLHVTNVPKDHLQVASGTGASQPSELLIAPVSIDGTVQAVLELGFFRPLHRGEIELLERVSEMLGIAVRTSKDRSQLENLLEETQRQAEELQAQQEELRVSNEELEEQSRVLKESQAQLEAQQAELEQTNSQLEEQTQALEHQKDALTDAQAVLSDKATELERTNQYKSEFLANMSHELRTPLNSTLILAKLLADNKGGNLSEEQVKFAQTISSAGNDLLDLINDILDLAKIESGKVELQIEPVTLARAVDSLVKTLQPLARQKGIGFNASIEADVPATIDTDLQRLSQILKNLLSNAVKFTERGEVSLRVSLTPRGVAFAVRDTGIGIPAHQQNIIFEAFRQADGSTHRKYGGTGLGLSISRDLSHLLGGEISVQSVPGQGSEFTLELPLNYVSSVQVVPAPGKPRGAAAAVPVAARPNEAAPPAASSAAMSWSSPPVSAPAGGALDAPAAGGLRPIAMDDDRGRLKADSRLILVIEDDERFAAILRDLAHEMGFQCVVTHSANDGLAAATQFRPSAILLDMNLPDHSGLGVLDQLKRNPKTRHIPVHVASVADYSQEALERGAIGYALKPVKREQLVDALQRLEAKFMQSLRRVLVVEDDARQRDSIRELLGSESGNGDVQITDVETAAQALQQLRSTTFDCMVMDLNLPDLSGYELLEQMAGQGDMPFPPVIVYTGRSLTRQEEQQLRKFSKSIIVKDARSPERLLDEVTLFLHHVEAKLPPESQRLLASARDREAALDGRRILVVEDDVRNIFALSSVLEPKGVKVEIARNGLEAIEALKRSLAQPASAAIDLVLMDIMMPEMDGFTAMREIRKRSEWKKLPIIALTAKAMKDDQEQCLAAGANDYIAKPLDVEKLLSLVRVWMPK